MRIDGSCHCGFIKYEGEADPEKAMVCHCTDCQTLSGSAFRTVVPVSSDTFRGNKRQQAFCPKCGSPIFSTSPDPGPKLYMIRTGTIRQRDSFVPKVQLWSRSKQRWVHDFAATHAVETQ